MIHKFLQVHLLTKLLYGCVKSAHFNLKAKVLKNHSRQIKFPCDWCGLILNSFHELDKHIHSNHKRYENFCCEFCNFKATNSTSLKKHLQCRHNIDSNSTGRKQHENNCYQERRGQSFGEERASYNEEKRGSFFDQRRGPYERRTNGFCRLWNNGICSFEFCIFLHEESPFCKYQKSRGFFTKSLTQHQKNISTERKIFLHFSPEISQKEGNKERKEEM